MGWRNACLLTAALIFVACSTGESKSEGVCSNPGNMGFCVCDGESSHDAVSECSEATMGGPVVCCQGPNDCICGRFKCTESTTSCTCTSVGVGNTSKACSGSFCCASTSGTCSCSGYDLGCMAGEVKVDNCSAATALCEQGTTRVEKCTPM